VGLSALVCASGTVVAAQAAMGFDKVFVFALDLDPAGGWAVQTRFVDTRTEARTEMPFMTVRMVR
jgi:hypothetical protein